MGSIVHWDISMILSENEKKKFIFYVAFNFNTSNFIGPEKMSNLLLDIYLVAAALFKFDFTVDEIKGI